MTMRIAVLLCAVVLGDVPMHAQSATASLAGVVLTDEDPARPVSRAVVTLTGAELRAARGAITDDNGRFAIEGLPGGRFTLKVEKPGFVASMYGAKRPARPGTALVLGDAERIADLTVTLWRGAVIAGTIHDDRGRPAVGVPVRVYRDGNVGAAAMPVLTNNGATTDARGQYRIFGLEPGSYVVAARVTGDIAAATRTLADARVDELLSMLQRGQRSGFASTIASGREATGSYAPVLYPGTTNVEQARVLTLTAGQEIAAVDFAIDAIPVSTISGVVRLPDGTPAAGATVTLTRVPRSTAIASFTTQALTAAAAPDGTFSVGDVTPGAYRATVRYRPPAPPAAPGVVQVVAPGGGSPDSASQALWASADLAASGIDLSGLTFTVGPGAMFRGRATFERDGIAQPVPSNVANVFISLQSTITGREVYGYARSDGTFAISAPPGDTLRLSVVLRGLDESWALGGATGPGGANWLDAPFELMNNADVTIAFTNRHTELSGRLQTAGGAPVSDLFVIAFSTDPQFWGVETRRVQAVRPAADGAFAIKDLPPGEYFLGALVDVDAGDWLRRGFLDSIAGASTKVTITDGGKTVQNLQIGR